MTDLVGTCPKSFWQEWLAEGDAAGTLETGNEYEWWTGHSFIRKIKPGDRFYVVAHDRLRGWAPVVRIELAPFSNGGAIIRGGHAVACTLNRRVAGFRGLRERWWGREDEIPFPDWRETKPHGHECGCDDCEEMWPSRLVR